MPQFKACIFDMDGVLLDSERIIRDVFTQVSTESGFVVSPEVYLKCVGRNSRDTRDIMSEHLGSDFPYEEIELKVRDLISKQITTSGWPLKPGVIDGLDALRENQIRCCVATSTEQNEARKRLQKLVHYFEHISSGDEVSKGKPDPELFLLAASRLAVDPKDCVVIEDSEYGAQAALSAGMSCLIVPDLKIPPEWLIPKVSGVFAGMDGALDWILRCSY
jgi:HAD superfamily hydrolase (TIGR01509 family)